MPERQYYQDNAVKCNYIMTTQCCRMQANYDPPILSNTIKFWPKSTNYSKIFWHWKTRC